SSNRLSSVGRRARFEAREPPERENDMRRSSMIARGGLGEVPPSAGRTEPSPVRGTAGDHPPPNPDTLLVSAPTRDRTLRIGANPKAPVRERAAGAIRPVAPNLAASWPHLAHAALQVRRGDAPLVFQGEAPRGGENIGFEKLVVQ